MYDWSQLTTVAWNEDPQLMCAAHAVGARVVLNAGPAAASPALLGNASERRAWVAGRLAHARALHLDGINFDMEDPLPPGDPLALGYTALVAEAAAAFHAAIPGSQVSVDVPWSPYDVDGRNYDWAGLARAADLLFVMAYDMQSQIWGRCVAAANSPLLLVRCGVRQWLQLGVPASKLVLGLPWYGYRYPCINPSFSARQDDLCALPPAPFRGCPCSDAAGSQVCFADIAEAIRRGSRPPAAAAVAASAAATAVAGASVARASSDAAAVTAAAAESTATAAAGPTTGSAALLTAGEAAAAAEAAAEAVAAGGSAGAGARRSGSGGAQTVIEEEREGGQLVCEPPGFDEGQASSFARCHLAGNGTTQGSFQVWFDTPRSLMLKYQLAAEMGLRGVGMWHLDCLDYVCTGESCRDETEAMWAALRAFTDAGSGSSSAGVSGS